MNKNPDNRKVSLRLFIYLFYLLQPISRRASWKNPINSDTASGKTTTSS